MSEVDDIQRVVAVLRTVPAKSLLIIELANQVILDGGEIDYDVLAARQNDVTLATAEAEAYARATAQATNTLAGLPARAA